MSDSAADRRLARTGDRVVVLLDEDGDGILDAAELVGGVSSFSVGLLRTMLISCLHWWVFLVMKYK